MAYHEQERRTSPTIRATVIAAVDKNDALAWKYKYRNKENGWTLSKDQNRRGIMDRVGAKEFMVDIPKAFFNDKGHFVAAPEYKKDEELHIRYTGYGKYFGFIDTNIIERGAGGGVGGDVECAKWS